MYATTIPRMVTICQRKNCHSCCQHTNMHLTNNEIIQIKKIYIKPFFIQTKDGWIHLKNHNGRCIFHDGTQCTIYSIRPMGCQLYPLVYSLDDHQPIYDSICPFPESFPPSPKKIKQLQSLITLLFKEQKQRRKRQNIPEKRD